MDPNDGVRLIFVTVVGVIMIMTELLVSGVGRPAWALAPPATLFLVPALGLGTDTGVINFLFIAVGYLAHPGRRRSEHDRSLDPRALPRLGGRIRRRGTGGLAGGGLPRRPGLSCTIMLGVALPTLALPGFGFGSGPGNGPLQLTDPTLDLRRNLTQPDDRVVIEYQTEDPGGVYLRMASLPQLVRAGWGNVADPS